MEIGSEFWIEGYQDNAHCLFGSEQSALFVLSGRTALDFVIKDIKTERELTSVSLPSYCCESMLEPFIRNNVSIYFYDVYCNEDGIQCAYDSNVATDAVLFLDYFGYSNPYLLHFVKQAQTAGKIVIYDRTHMLNSHPSVETCTDYSFCSYRKWFYANAASVMKNNGGRWHISYADLRSNTQYTNLRNVAARLKQEYINDKSVDKREYLRKFSEAEELLDRDYEDYVAEFESVQRIKNIDMIGITKKRRENSERLTAGLRSLGFSWLFLPLNVVRECDCPLFVPVIVEKELRDIVRARLIDNSIYSPIHWPFSKQHYRCGLVESDQSLYGREISLICDQRYGFSDMDRIIETVKTIGGAI